MRWLSESVEALVARELADAQGKPVVHKAVVVGSGYGGAVAALRLAQRGVPVLVLERGKEYSAGEFPNDLGDAFGHVRLERGGSRPVSGYESGLYDLRLGDGIGALVGNALGGTSQINANVVLAPDPRVFGKKKNGADAWPPEFKPSNRPAGFSIQYSLLRGYVRARQMLEPQEFTDDVNWLGDPKRPGVSFAAPVQPLKRQRLAELKDKIESEKPPEVRVSLCSVDLTVDLGRGGPGLPKGVPTYACEGCGDCVSGCNRSSKKTLTYTYLPRAYEAGARMYTGVTVLSVRKDGDVWAVRFVRTESRKQQRDGVPVPVHELRAHHVVLAAGTFGSTEILLRSRCDHDLALSKTLGHGLSTNGDSLAFGYMLNKRVNGMGLGSESPWGVGYAVGPTITATIRVDHDTDVTRSMLIQDGAIPGAITGLFQELVSTSAAFAQLDLHRFRDMPPRGTPPEDARDWAVLQQRARTNTQTLLGIGHDPSAGIIRFDRKHDGLRFSYPRLAIEPVAQLHETYLRQVQTQGAVFLPNPAAKPVPDGVTKLLSGPPIGGGTFTVHPLGGCCMAEDAARGVVNHLGKVFDAAGGVHRGLYVLDGSIVPTSLGANPLFTITALAERAMAVIAREIAPVPGAARLRAFPPNLGAGAEPASNPYAREVNVHFTEAMRASGGKWRWQEQDCNAHLVLHMPIDNLDLFGTDGRHVITIPDQLGAQMRDKEQLEPQLRVDSAGATAQPLARLPVKSGWVSILPVPQVGRFAHAGLWLRTALTWLIERGWDEIWRDMLRIGPRNPAITVCDKFKGFLKLCSHASEHRTMEYRLNLQDTQARGDSVRRYTLRGVKTVGYAADCCAIARYLLGLERPLKRANVWAAFGELHATVCDEDGKEVGSGLLVLDMLDMTRMHAPQLASQRDTPNALLGLAGYPLWFFRLLAKTRLWDFRLPDYPSHLPTELATDPQGNPLPVPAQETATPWPKFPPLRIAGAGRCALKRVCAEPSLAFEVPQSETNANRLQLKLTRYRQPALAMQPTHQGMVQCKALLMLNGFAQSTLGFVPQEHVRRPGRDDDEPGLAEFFYEQGFDIWLFDYRTSSILDASKEPGTMDDIARFDIPEAIKRMLLTLAGESGTPPEKLQIYAFAHCVGAASLAMSMLGGFLKHPCGRDKLAGVTFSQMQAFLIGSKTAQMRLQVGGILRDALGIDFMRLSAAERQPSMLESLLDRLFASLPTDPGERCPHEDSRIRLRPGICTCKRMSGTISRLLKHDRIKPATHDRLPVYFGRANTSLLVHGGRCVDNERLVNADGQNVYVTEANIESHLQLPVAILHGRHNALFNVESARRTHEQLCRVNPHMRKARVYPLIIARDYAHFDCTIGYGRDMQRQILRPLGAFYRRAWAYQGAGAAPRPDPLPGLVPGSLAKAPLAGPLVGWTRTVQKLGRTVRQVRLWIEVDESESDKARCVVTQRARITGGELPDESAFEDGQLWPVIRVPLKQLPGRPDVADLAQLQPGDNEPYVAIALADLEFDITGGWDDENVIVRMFSVHVTRYKPATPEPVPDGGEGPRYPALDGGGPMGIPPPLTSSGQQDAIRDGLKPMNEQWRLSQSDGLMIGPAAAAPAPASQTLVASIGRIGKAQSNQLWKTLLDAQQRQRESALRPEPGTLSRKLRRFALPGAFGSGLAFLRAATIQGSTTPNGLVFVCASCRHPGLAFEDTRADASLLRIERHLKTQATLPAFMLMLGDQIYADATAGVMDSPSAIEKITLRHRKAFTTSGFLRLTSSLPTYMTIDDHEIADNWSRDLLASQAAQELFDTARASFAAYQWAHGPRNCAAPGFNYHFEEGGCPFFVIDTRSNRRRYSDPPQVCDPGQLQELGTWLASLPADARPKFIVSGSVFAPALTENAAAAPGFSDRASDNWQMASQQRMQVLDIIETHSVRNVVFVSGDYHCAATARLSIGANLSAYAVVAPPLYAQLPAANVKNWQIAEYEELTLASGTQVRIEARAHAGDGFAQIRAMAQPGGTWRLEIGLDQSDLSAKAPEGEDTARCFTLR